MVTGYTDQFFRDQRQQGLRSARAVVPLVIEWVAPSSVVDVGCGVGTWVSVFKELGVSDALGVDGAWAATFSELAEGEFLKRDLSRPFAIGRRFDLCVCLEVAEHLPPDCADRFVRSLTELSDVVLFSAAVPLQGGTHHVNEQWPDYWARLFEDQGYAAIDCVRPAVWDNALVDWWYAQNTFLYVRREYLDRHPALLTLAARGSVLPLRAVHPRHYFEKARRANIGLADVVKSLPELAITALNRRIRHFGRRLYAIACR